MNTQELSKVCRQVRRDIITMTANAGSGHPGGSLSAVELMTSVFFNHMRVDPSNPHDPDRDRFVLSKGHAAPCYYAVLAAKGFISRDEYANFRQLHSILQGHPDAKKVPGVDYPHLDFPYVVFPYQDLPVVASHISRRPCRTSCLYRPVFCAGRDSHAFQAP